MILKDNEKIEDLQLKGLKIIQNKKWFCFGMDSVLLSDFADLKKKSIVVDLGTGTGIIPLLLWGKKEPHKIYGIEIQDEVAEMAKRSVTMNNLDEKIEILNIDMKEVEDHIKNNSVDAVVTNPPYVESNGGIVNPEDKKALSRHEISCSLEDVIRTSARLLKHHGRFYMVHRPYRMADIIELMRKYKLEPKKMRLVYPRQGKNPNMILVKGVKGGNPEMNIDPPLYVYKDEENYTDEIYEIYGMERKDGR